MTEKPITLLWLRQNLRLADNPALHWAASRGAIVPVYILNTGIDDPFPPGGASKWWLHENLQNLGESFAKLGAPLILRRGEPEKILRELIKETGATSVNWQRYYEPFWMAYDQKLADALEQDGIEVAIHDGFLLFGPKEIKTGSGTPYKVFTPFSKACFGAPAPGKPHATPQKLDGITGIKSDKLADWKLVPKKAVWPKGLAEAWVPGEKAAHKNLQNFIDKKLGSYKTGRDRPDKDLTSLLSPYLHFGNISPRQIWHAAQKAHLNDHTQGSHIERFLLEILWREFSWHLLVHFPYTVSKPLNPSFADFPWEKNDRALQAWQKGMTGYPIVDAGMRQLWQTGWMHNRVRMIVASFLIKDLLIDWREGAAWFWDTLVDADLGNNTASWQWVAGSGADASPYFRIFNPTLQGEKFDASGDYVRRYVPELSALSAKFIHEPWQAPAAELAKAKVVLGKTYPRPVVDHGKARLKALAALKSTKSDASQETETKDLFD